MTVLESTERFTAAARAGGGWKKWLALALLAVLTGAAIWLVWFSSVLSVQEVRVVGAAGERGAGLARTAAAVVRDGGLTEITPGTETVLVLEPGPGTNGEGGRA